MKRFLEYGLANGVLPDIMSWHEWSPELSYLPDHTADVVAYLNQNPKIAKVCGLIHTCCVWSPCTQCVPEVVLFKNPVSVSLFKIVVTPQHPS